MAALAIAAVGAGAGGIIGGSFLGVASTQWGWMLGSIVGNMLFGAEGVDSHGPRLKDTTYAGEVEGTDMPILWGGDRMPGKPIWMKTPPLEVRKKEESGGKGGGGGSSFTSYTYYQDVALCFGYFNSPKPRRVWANNELIYDASGTNTEFTTAGFSFIWYDGLDPTIDSLIEQDVGVGNCSGYLGRSVMVISSLNLTEKYGNRLPVIEAELQTTGTESTQLYTYSLGDIVPGSSNGGTRDVLRHPTDNTIICTSFGSNSVGAPVLHADMRNQYCEILWDGSVSNANGIIWFTDPYANDPHAVTSFLYSEYYSLTGGTIYQVEYPEGKTIRTYSVSGSGGMSFIGESHQWIAIFPRNLTSSFKLIDKFTWGISSSYSFATIIEAGMSSSAFDGRWACIDYFANKFAFVGKNSSFSDTYGYFVLQAVPLLSPTGSRVSEPFLDYLGASLEPDYDAIASIPVYIPETNELWVGWNKDPSADPGIMALDADTGDVVFWYDFVIAGDTTASSYWGISSGYPHLHFEPTQRLIWWSMSGTGDVGNINVDSRKIQWYPGADVGNSWAISYPPRNSIWGAITPGVFPDETWEFKERRLGIVSKNTISIATIASAILDEVGFEASEYDVSPLAPYYIGSFIHGTRHSARADLELLLGIAQCDAVQSDYKIKFVPRGGAVTATISADNLGAQELTGEPTAKDPVNITLPMETELPKVFEIQYRSSDNLYNQGIAQSYIATGTSNDISTVQLPVAMSDQQAAEVCERYHQQMFDPRTFKFDLPVQYTYLEATDVLEIPKGNKNYRVRITHINGGANWLMQCQGIADYAEHQTSTAVVPGVDEYLGTISTSQTPKTLLLDGPLLRDADLDQPGPYLTSFVYSTNFPASTWYYSVDDSVFGELTSQVGQPGIGLVDVAKNTEVWEAWDEITQLDVTILNGVSLSSSTKAAILLDQTINAFAYGRSGRWEYLNAATVTLVQSTPTVVYRLTDLLRGRRGTNNNIDNHQEKDYLIVLGDTGLYRTVLQNSQIGNTLFYRLATASVGVADTESTVHEVLAQPLKPYSPIQIEGTPHTTEAWAASTAYVLNDEVEGTSSDSRRYVCTTAGTSGGTEPTWDTTIGNTTTDGGGSLVWTAEHLLDFDIAWTRRTRRGGSLGGDNTLTDGVGGPLEEDTETYDLEYVNSSNGTVVATVSGLSSPEHEYLGVDQETDNIDLLGQFYIDVYQLSATVGRGYRGRGLYDRGWGSVINTGINLGAKALFPLDDAAGGTAKDWITFTEIGTYTSASEADGVGTDGRKALASDGTGYMKCGVALKTILDGKTAATLAYFSRGGATSNAENIAITKGGSTMRGHLFESVSYPRAGWSVKAGTGLVTINAPSASEYILGQNYMAHTTIKITGSGIDLTCGVNGVVNQATSLGTGHSTYASSFQSDSRDTNYNDTIHGDIGVTPTAIPSLGAGAFAMVFDRDLSLSELRQLYVASHTRYLDYVDSNSCIYQNRLDKDSVTQTPRIGTGDMTLHSTSYNYPSCMAAADVGCYQFTATTGRSIYRELTSEFKLQEFTVSLWFATIDNGGSGVNLTGEHRLLSLSPRDWSNAGGGYKGVHIYADTTNGLQIDVGVGTGTWSSISSGSANVTGGNHYNVVATFHPTNGVRLYLNGSSVGTPLGASTIDWVDGGSGGPSPGQIYINSDNSNASITSENYTCLKGRYNDFTFFEKEFSAVEVLALYERGSGTG